MRGALRVGTRVAYHARQPAIAVSASSRETNLQLFRGLDHTTAQTNDTISFVCVDGTKWVELGRSDNT